ncbi:MAG TPA: type II toxin-antitoxin system VapC family toxin [Pseudonocardia sp.]|uniref:type II toxin-antitoxin system VapC family toxin n=1 Tax=Pseudonocardia sp. TaxID=60912 RepID=UPI002F4191EB
MTVYVETSAAAKLLVDEAESTALAAALDKLADDEIRLVSSMPLETELRRLAVRHELSQTDVTKLLDRFELFELDRAVYVSAGLLPGPQLRSLDALHIAVALRVGAESMIAYDIQKTNSARAVGLRVLAPCS